jgi:hypothetical protein
MNNPKLAAFFYPLGATALAILVFFPFEGGLFFNLLARPYFILPLLIITIILVIRLVNSLMLALTGKEKLSKIKTSSAIAVCIIFTIQFFTTAEIFKSKILLHATLDDDIFHENVVLRKNGSCEVETAGWLGFNDIKKSNYVMQGDTIFLFFKVDESPKFGNFLLIDTAQRVIFFNIDSVGHFNKDLEWLNYLEIHHIDKSLWPEN